MRSGGGAPRPLPTAPVTPRKLMTHRPCSALTYMSLAPAARIGPRGLRDRENRAWSVLAWFGSFCRPTVPPLLTSKGQTPSVLFPFQWIGEGAARQLATSAKTRMVTEDQVATTLVNVRKLAGTRISSIHRPWRVGARRGRRCRATPHPLARRSLPGARHLHTNTPSEPGTTFMNNVRTSTVTSENNPAAVQQFVSPVEAAAELGLSKWTIYRACASGALRASKPTGPRGRWLIGRDDLLAWVDRGVAAHEQAAPTGRRATVALGAARPARERLAALRAGGERV